MPPGSNTPALFTRRLILANCLRTASANCSTSCLIVKSVGTPKKVCCGYATFSSSNNFSIVVLSRAQKATLNPLAAKVFTVARPLPRVPPVILRFFLSI